MLWKGEPTFVIYFFSDSPACVESGSRSVFSLRGKIQTALVFWFKAQFSRVRRYTSSVEDIKRFHLTPLCMTSSCRLCSTDWKLGASVWKREVRMLVFPAACERGSVFMSVWTVNVNVCSGAPRCVCIKVIWLHGLGQERAKSFLL